MVGLVIRKDNGDLKWFPLFYHKDRYQFYPPRGEKTGREVGRDWYFKEYILGYWMPTSTPAKERRIGGGNSLITLDDDGDLKFYPFREETFMHMGTGDKVGSGFRETLDYFVADWTNNGTSDLLCRDEDGDLRLYPFDGKKFRDLGRHEKVGNGFGKKNVPDIYPGYWSGGNTPDILIRKKNGDLVVFEFNGETFYKQRNYKVGDDFKPKHYQHLLMGYWLGNDTPDMLAYRDKRLRLYPYGPNPKKDHFTFTNKKQWESDKDFRKDWIYLVGHWRKIGKPDLITVNKSNDLWFYPFDNGVLTDLRGDKQVGNDWKVSHFWDFYPV